MLRQGWQSETLETLSAMLSPDPAALALLVYGSAARLEADIWSDLDVLLVAGDLEQARFSPGLDWLKPLGDVYAAEHSATPFASVSRICLTDMRRLDIVVTTEAALEQVATWPTVPFADETARAVLFSRSPVLDRALARPLPKHPLRLPSTEDFQGMSDSFWYKGSLAVTKVMRDDRLIALHLALEMLQDCLVLGMLLRDRTEGTSHHRSGGGGNILVDTVDTTLIAPTGHDILRLLEQCSRHYDTLAAQWQAGYEARRKPLLTFISAARRQLEETAPL